MLRPLIVLDSNALFDDPTLSRSSSARLLTLARRAKIDLVVPEVVLLELQRQHRKTVLGRIDHLVKVDAKIEQSLRILGLDLFDYYYELPDFNQLDDTRLLGAIFTRVRERLLNAGVEILPVPEVSHHELLTRDLNATLPFASNGKGYRDALIWHSIVTRWPTTPLMNAYIVTNDTDFGIGGLAPELLAELPDGSDPVIVASIPDLIALDAISQLHAEGEDPDVLVDEDEAAASDAALAEELAARDASELLTEAAEAAVFSAAENLHDVQVSYQQRRTLDLPRELNDLTLATATARGDFEWSLSEELDGETLLGHAFVTAEVELTATVDKSDAAVLAEPSIHVDGWSDDEAEVTIWREARLTFEFRIETAGMVIGDLTFVGIE